MGRATRNYAVGNLKAGPGQWVNMYITGSSITLLFKILFLAMGFSQGLISSSLSGAMNKLTAFILEVVNAYIPLVAVAFSQPLSALMTFAFNALFGWLIWVGSYAASRRGYR